MKLLSSAWVSNKLLGIVVPSVSAIPVCFHIGNNSIAVFKRALSLKIFYLLYLKQIPISGSVVLHSAGLVWR